MLLQYIDDVLLVGQTWEDVWKGFASFFLFYGRQNTQSLGKRPRFAKALSSTVAFTCSMGNAGSALRGNRLSVLS
jgi:hypothetical protein